AQGDVRISARANVAYGGEAGFEGDASTPRADQRGARIGNVQTTRPYHVRRHGEVRVAIDQARKNGELREIDCLCTGGKFFADVGSRAGRFVFSSLGSDAMIRGVRS